MAKNYRTDAELPMVIVDGGKFYVFDGHHRITAAKMSGKELVKVKLYLPKARKSPK